jgi:hypothetical protein
MSVTRGCESSVFALPDFFAHRLALIFRLLRVPLPPQIIKAVNLDSEKLQRRDGEDGCRQFWSAYQQLQTGLLDVATAHATFAMKLHAHVMEPLKECGEQSEQVCAV